MRRKWWMFTCALAAACGAGGPLAAAPLHTISARIDGRDEMRISNGNLVVDHITFGHPTNLTVDGSPKTLFWAGNTSAPVPVSISPASDYWVMKTLGRDGGWAVQRADGFMLAGVDNPLGDDLYQFQLHAAPEATTAEWMRVRGGGGTPGRMRFAGSPGYTPRPAGTETTFSLAVDGGDELMFVNGNLVIRHLSWVVPGALTINGVPHPLVFGPDNLSQPIPVALPDEFQFVQTGGRTTLYPVETAAGLMIGADDELGGHDTYTWTVVAVPEPAGAAVLAGGVVMLLGRRRRGR